MKKQKTLDPYAKEYSKRLWEKVKQIKKRQDNKFVNQYFNDYDNSEVKKQDE